MALRVLIAGTDRVAALAHGSITVDSRVNGVGSAAFRVLSTAGWRPGLLDEVEMWEVQTSVGDAAITTAGYTTGAPYYTTALGYPRLETTSVTWTSTHVGRHVWLQDGRGTSLPLRAEIAAWVASSAVTLAQGAVSTMTGKTLWVGRARFFGQTHDVKEVRSRPDHLVFGVQCSDRLRVFEWIYPNVGVGAFFDHYGHASLLIDNSAIETHSVYLHWPSTHTGSMLSCQQYYGETLHEDLTSLLEDEGENRHWRCDALGRFAVTFSSESASGETLSSGNDNVRVVSPPTVTRQTGRDNYANRVTVGPGGSGAQQSCSTAEQDALGGRIFEFFETVSWADTDPEAQARADWQLAYRATRAVYLADLETTLDGLSVGQTLTVTLPLHGMSSTVHVIQAMRSRYEPTRQDWIHTLTVTNEGARPRQTWQDYWRSLR